MTTQRKDRSHNRYSRYAAWFTEEECQIVRDLRATGMRNAAIAARMGRPESGVKHLVTKLDLPRRKRWGRGVSRRPGTGAADRAEGQKP
jgi:DNA-binding CsgD family transcriptional regulator